MAEFIKYLAVSQFLNADWVNLISIPLDNEFNEETIDKAKSTIEDMFINREMVCLMTPTESIIIYPKLGPVRILIKSKIKKS